MNFYDFEVYDKLWCVTIINPVARTDIEIVNDREKLVEYYEAHKDEIWLGYNSRNYDQYILKAILCDFNPKEVNDYIIVQKKKGCSFSNLFRQFQLYDFDVMTGFNSLKTLEGFMGHDIRETEIPFDYEGDFTPEMIEQVLKYNRHDVEELIEVFLKRKVEFDAQMALIKIFNLGLSDVSRSQAQLAAKILGAKRVETNDEWEIRLPETLRLNKYEYVARWFMNPVNHNENVCLDAEIADVLHIFAWGGVHGAIPKYNYTCKPDEILVMADVSQLYPFLMLKYHLLSRGVPESGYKILEDTINTSLKLKAEGKKAEREPYKRFNNIIYGAMGHKTNAMYDPLHRNLVCVFGQLLILDLIEKIEPFAELIQSNTDGILVKIKKSDWERFDDTVYEWEKRTGLSMTFDEYTQVWQGDVNNYCIVDAKGGFKTKGAYVKKLNPLDYDLPIVNKAIVDFLTKNVPVEKTVENCDKLIEFQKIVKVSSKYAHGWHNGKPLTDKTFRVFASKDWNDSAICKCKQTGAKPEKFANTPLCCKIYNDDISDMNVPDWLDKRWYINLARKRIKEKFAINC